MSVYNFGFLVEQVAGHVTNYKNLRRVVDEDRDVAATWSEIVYHKEGGAIERLKFIPPYAAGIARATWETRKAIRQSRYAALFCNTTVGVFFGRSFRKTPTLIDLDSTPMQIDRMPAYQSPPDRAPVAKLKWMLAKDMLTSAAVVQAWSRWAKESAVVDYGVPPDRVVVNPPGVDLELWRRRSERPSGEDRALRVLFVGGDFKRKGGDVLLEWYRTWQGPKAELHVVTKEPIAKSAGVFVYDDIRPNDGRLIELLHTSDLFVLPSLGECFGIATVEAMAAGLPVIASDVGGTADIIEPGRNGFIVPANDVASLGKAIGEILGDAGKRASMATESRRMAEERFDLRTNAKRTIEYMKQIAQRPAPN
jgi:glycosyltransferase involved in cell wall biosynthesis